MQQNTAIQLVILRFSNLHILWRFAHSLTHPVFEIDTSRIILTCQCTTYELNEAVDKYEAITIQATNAN